MYKMSTFCNFVMKEYRNSGIRVLSIKASVGDVSVKHRLDRKQSK